MFLTPIDFLFGKLTTSMQWFFYFSTKIFFSASFDLILVFSSFCTIILLHFPNEWLIHLQWLLNSGSLSYSISTQKVNPFNQDIYLISLTKLRSTNTLTKCPKSLLNEGLLVAKSIHIGVYILIAMSNRMMGLQ